MSPSVGSCPWVSGKQLWRDFQKRVAAPLPFEHKQWFGVKGFSLLKAGKMMMKENICREKNKIKEAQRSTKYCGAMSEWFLKKAERQK